MGLLLGLLTLAAVIFGAALVVWGLAFSTLYGLWIFVILLVPPLLIGQSLGAITVLASRRLPQFSAALQSYLAGHATPFAAPALATALAGHLLGPAQHVLPPWRAAVALYGATTLGLTLIWAIVQPGDAARFYFGLTGTEVFPLNPEPQLARAVGLWLLTAAAFFPAFVAALALTKRALPDLAWIPHREGILAAVEMIAGIAVAVVATEALYVAAENMVTGREAFELGAFDALAAFWQTGFLMRAYLGYPSSGIFFYAAFAVPLWLAAVAAAAGLLHGLAERGVTIRGLARFQGKPVEAVAAIGFRLVPLVNVGLIFLRAFATDLSDPSAQNPAPIGAPLTAAALVTQFDRLVFGENDRVAIDKRTVPISVSVEGANTLSARHSTTLDAVLADLSTLTNLSFARTDRDGAIRIAFVPLRTLNPLHFNTAHGLAAGPLILAVCSASASGQIYLGRENASELNEHCLPHEFMHAIGFGGHACAIRPSALCNRDLTPRYTEADRRLIRTLYHPNLINGMTRQEAMPLVRDILGEMDISPGVGTTP
ncbi:MAG: DUF2927 domain-containing protein [Alphaproteobacteria bacterium]|nr:DUF2927 domain-containing protein [Alphaproteobacteria bacterium]